MTLATDHGLAYKVVHDPSTTSHDDVDETREYIQVVERATGTSATITAADPNYGSVVQAILGVTDHAYSGEEVMALINPTLRLRALTDELRRVSERITYADGWFYDSRPMENALTKHIEKMYVAGDRNWQRYARFLDNLALNPSERSKRHLFRWMERHEVVLTEDGHLLMWKAIRGDGRSSHGGAAFVDGVLVEGRIPNKVGSVISMPRERVDPERGSACSFGLHVGNKTYAEWFLRQQCGGITGRIVMCKVHPRDVVSVPSDDSQKVRTCRYEVTDVSASTQFGPTYAEGDGDYEKDSWLRTWDVYDPERDPDEGEDDGYGDECDNCGEPVDPGYDLCDSCEEDEDEDDAPTAYVPPF